jgi:hypothetical protein
VGALDDPASRLPRRVELTGLDFFVAGLDVGDHAVFGDGDRDLLGAVAAVQAEADRGWLDVVVGLGQRDDQRLERGLKQLLVVSVGGGDYEPDRDTRGLADD